MPTLNSLSVTLGVPFMATGHDNRGTPAADWATGLAAKKQRPLTTLEERQSGGPSSSCSPSTANDIQVAAVISRSQSSPPSRR